MLATITVLALATAAPATLAGADLAPIRPRNLEVEIEQATADTAALVADFRLDTGESGTLRLDISNGAIEADFSVDGVPHVWLRQLDGEGPETWLSPEIEGRPALMRTYWGVVSDLRLYEHEVTAKNPLCGALKWGLRALAVVAGAGCCVGGSPIGLCLVCVVGASDAYEAANAIDCNKECKPDCPIP